ncbi:hypothetical protein F6X68_06660 [Micromonospora sp. AMSO12t]|uniref:hypothetical protein n=1 Tax=Micromonospora sp. AMSO12t TaxID=2650410 RepID=UPI00124AF6A8|nr:hypothetical protein [Micromonospora sp. AMSO12t]KAB1160984.1 hypothetical protein F6X68_06660 [Micromonospora sp. AMSO12t]
MALEIPWDKLEWGTVPAGVGSILTSVSLLIAALAYRHSRIDARKGQAKQIAAWLEGLDRRGAKVRLAAKNASDLPIYQVTIRCKGIEVIKPEYLAVMAPDGDWDLTRDFIHLAVVQAIKKAGPVPHEVQPSISFRDAAGRCWERRSDGRLRSRWSWLHQRRWSKGFTQQVAPVTEVEEDD